MLFFDNTHDYIPLETSRKYGRAKKMDGGNGETYSHGLRIELSPALGCPRNGTFNVLRNVDWRLRYLVTWNNWTTINSWICCSNDNDEYTSFYGQYVKYGRLHSTLPGRSRGHACCQTTATYSAAVSAGASAACCHGTPKHPAGHAADPGRHVVRGEGYGPGDLEL